MMMNENNGNGRRMMDIPRFVPIFFYLDEAGGNQVIIKTAHKAYKDLEILQSGPDATKKLIES